MKWTAWRNSGRRRAIVGGLTALLFSSGAAFPQCTATAEGDASRVRLAESLASNSDSPAVRAAYADHRCNIRKAMHGGGRPCEPGIPLDHVTIRVFGAATYHVFPVRLADGRFCTTP